MQRRRKRRSRLPVLLLIVVVAVGAGWWFWPRGEGETAGRRNGATDSAELAGAGDARSAIPEAVVRGGEDVSEDEVLRPVGPGGEGRVTSVEDRSGLEAEPESAHVVDANPDQPEGPPDSSEQLSSNPRINSALQRYQAGQMITARQELNRMLAVSRNASEQAELRRHLKTMADETVFSRRQISDDPLFEAYAIQPGEYLINIGKQFDVPHEALMLINGIEDPTRIQAGQIIKVPRGPFNAKIERGKFRLDVYLRDLYLRSYPVGLGTDQGTPLGEWVVKERLPNPTYYPPASAPQKAIIPPNDPTNPLGEHWIGLEGVEGEALGRVGYGIHGTIEPEKIGQAVSLGCIRMHNQDVAFLYKLMMPGSSKVTTLP